MCTPPFEKSAIKPHRFYVLPPFEKSPSKSPLVLCSPPLWKSLFFVGAYFGVGVYFGKYGWSKKFVNEIDCVKLRQPSRIENRFLFFENENERFPSGKGFRIEEEIKFRYGMDVYFPRSTTTEAKFGQAPENEPPRFPSLKLNVLVRLPVRPRFSQLFIPAIQWRNVFLNTLWTNDYGITLDTEMIAHIVFQKSVIVPDSKFQSHSFIKETIRKIFSVEWLLQKIKKKKTKEKIKRKKCCHGAESNQWRSTSNTWKSTRFVFHRPVRIWPLPSYCEESTRHLHPLAHHGNAPCLNSDFPLYAI